MNASRQALNRLLDRAEKLRYQDKRVPIVGGPVVTTSVGAFPLLTTSARAELTKDLRALSHIGRKRLLEMMAKRLTEKAKPLMELLANAEDSTEALLQFRENAFAHYTILDRDAGNLPDIASASDQELLSLRDELRAVWNRSGHEEILLKWWRMYPLTDASAWVTLYESGAFFPTEKNTRALMARVCFEKSELLDRCPACNQRFFLKNRQSDKYCLDTDECRRYGNRERNRKARKNQKKGR